MTQQQPQIPNISPVQTVTGEDADYTTSVPTLVTVEQQARQAQSAPQFTPAGQPAQQAVPPTVPQQQQPPAPVPQEQQTGQLPPWMTQQQQSAPVAQAPPIQQQPAPQQQAPPPQQPQFDQQQIAQVIQQALGVSPEEFRAGVEYIRQQQSQQVIEQGRQQVLQMWQVDQVEADRRIGHVREYFSRLPLDVQQAYDRIGVSALPTLWYEVTRQYPAIANAQPVPLDRSQFTGNMSTSGYMFTRSQLNGMSDAERRRLDPQILHASLNGLIYEDEN